MTTTRPDRPPMEPDTSEADERQLELAREQGEAYGRALAHMAERVADDGGEQTAGQYQVAYAVEEAEGMYHWDDGELVWHGPGDDNAHIEISVRDASDGRFVPGVGVTVTVVDPDGNEVGTHEHPLLWHPMIYHYGRNWQLPADGDYTLRVHIDPPTFHRHDEVNGRRFTDPVDVEFTGVAIERGQD
jgi:hypothetical protein